MQDSNDRILRIAEVVKLTGLSKTTIWRYCKAGKFVERRRIGVYAVGFLSGEVKSWISSRPVIRD